MIKLVATDIDGTILGKSGEFTQGVKDCIKTLQEKDIKVVIVTGRMYAGAKKIAKRLNLTTPVVSYQGGLIKDIDGTVLYEKFLPENIAKEIISWANENNVHLNLYTNDMLYSEKDDDEIKRYAEYQELDYNVKDFSEIPMDKINKLLAIDYNDKDRVTDWVNTMSKKYPNLHIVKSTPYFCEFSTNEATKACAVKFLEKYNMKYVIVDTNNMSIDEMNAYVERIIDGVENEYKESNRE